MLDPFTEQQLIELIQSKAPDDLSSDEVNRLRVPQAASLDSSAILQQSQLDPELAKAWKRYFDDLTTTNDKVGKNVLGSRFASVRVWQIAFGVTVSLLIGTWILILLNGSTDEDRDSNIPTHSGRPKDGGSNTNDSLAANSTQKKEPNWDGNKSNRAAKANGHQSSTDSDPPKTNQRPKPWAKLLAANAAPVAFDESCFVEFEQGDPIQLEAKELKLWFDAVPGYHHRLADVKINDSRSRPRVFSRFEGLARLRAPWPSDAVLRLNMYDAKKLEIHFWNGTDGVSLRFYPNRRPNVWAAFSTTRDGNGPRPSQFVFKSADNGRHHRTRLGMFEIRHQDGSLVMTRGDLTLFSVPMTSPPEEIYFDANVVIRHLSIFRGTPAPHEPSRPFVETLPTTRPAHLKWITTLPNDATFTNVGPSVQLLTVAGEQQNDFKNLANAVVQLSDRRLSEIIVRIADADLGTGIFLGDANGKPQRKIGYVVDRRSSRKVLTLMAGTENRIEADYDFNVIPPPYAGPNQWLRIVAGLNTLKVWISGDGRSWGRLADTVVRGFDSRFATLGLYAIPGSEPRVLRLDHISVRELAGITRLAAPAVRDRVPTYPSLEKMDYSSWLHFTLVNRPDNVDPSEWRRAAAIETLQRNPSLALGNLLADALIEDSWRLPMLGHERFRMLNDFALMLDLWDASAAQAFARNYAKCARLTAAGSEVSAFGVVERALLSAPIWTGLDTFPADQEMLGQQLVASIDQQDWSTVAELIRQNRFWNEHGHPQTKWSSRFAALEPILKAVEGIAAIGLPRKEGVPASERKLPWAHPLIVELSKDAYNVKAEFDAAIEGEAFADACRIISDAETSKLPGVLPDATDPQLLMPLSSAVALAMREHLSLAATMNEQFGSAGLLRVRQAIELADSETIESATQQFYGTQAAAEAHLWLGDRAFSTGRFAIALDHYRHSLVGPHGLDRQKLLARIKLAMAVIGRTDAEPLETAKFGTTNFNSTQLQALFKELSETHITHPGAGATTIQTLGHDRIPEPHEFAAHVRAAFDGSIGTHPERIRSSATDWVARQLATVTDATTIYVSNRFQVSAYDINSGARRWNTALGGEQGETHWLPFVAMKPLLDGSRLFVRRITKSGPEMACLEKSAGKVLWNRRPEKHQLVSDPIIANGKLLAVIAHFVDGGQVELHLGEFAVATGEILAESFLVRLTDIWSRQLPCQVASHSGRIILAIDGCVLCCDAAGRVIWVRRQSWFPASFDATRFEHHAVRPIIDDDRIFVTQPGSRSVSCIEFESGRLLWIRSIPGIRRLLGLTTGRILIETHDGFESRDRLNGKLYWKQPANPRLNGYLCSADGTLLSLEYVERLVAKKKQRQLRLVWRDSHTGRVVERTVVPQLVDPDIQFGPLISTPNKIWGFFGKGPKDARRDLVELQPIKKLLMTQTESDSATWSGWIPPISQPHVAQGLAVVLPGWQMITPISQPKDAGQRDKFQSQPVVFAMQLATASAASLKPLSPRVAAAWTPEAATIRFFRMVDVPRDGKLALAIRAGHDATADWQLAIDIDGDEVVRTRIDDKTAPKVWYSLEIPLNSYAGRRVCLVVSQTPLDPKNRRYAYLQQLKLIPK